MEPSSSKSEVSLGCDTGQRHRTPLSALYQPNPAMLLASRLTCCSENIKTQQIFYLCLKKKKTTGLQEYKLPFESSLSELLKEKNNKKKR